MNKIRLLWLIGILLTLLAALFLKDLFKSKRDEYGTGVLFENPEEGSRQTETSAKDPALLELGPDQERKELKDGNQSPSTSVSTIIHFRLTDELNQPIANASICAWTSDKLHKPKVSNGDGEFTYNDLSGNGGLVIQALNWYPQFHEVEFNQNQIDVVLVSKAVVGGTVSFSGDRHKKTPFDLTILTLPDLEIGPFPQALKKQLKKVGFGSYEIKATVFEDLRFQVKGYPPSWNGRMKLPYGTLLKSFQGPGEVSDWGKFIDLLKPSDQLHLELAQMPAFSGRVVSPDGKEGVPNPELTLIRYSNDKANSMIVGAAGKPDGTFSIPLGPSGEDEYLSWIENPNDVPTYQVAIWVDGNDKWAASYFEFDLRDRGDPWNLGDLPMRDRLQIPIQVVNSDGHPIEGARAFGDNISEPTDALGNGVVSFSEGVQVITAAAVGYEFQDRALDQAINGVLRFELEPATSVQVTWSNPDDLNLSSLQIKIISDGLLFKTDHHHADYRLRYGLGQPMISHGKPSAADGSHGGFSVWDIGADQSEFRLWGLSPRSGFTAQLVGPLGEPILASQPFKLQPGVQNSLYLGAVRSRGGLKGTVRLANGETMANVEVRITRAKYETARYTDNQGKFSLPLLGARTVDLTVTAPGHEEFQLKNVEIYLGRDPIQITLQPKQ